MLRFRVEQRGSKTWLSWVCPQFLYELLMSCGLWARALITRLPVSSFCKMGKNKPCPACTLSLMRAGRVNRGECASGKSWVSAGRAYRYNLPGDTGKESESESRSVVSSSLQLHRTVAHGILQARILQWVAFSFSRGSSQPRDWNQVSLIAGRFFTSWATREDLVY